MIFLKKRKKTGFIKDVSFAITQIENGNYLITCLFSAFIFYLVKSGVFMLRSRSSSIKFATMYLHCKNWRDADVAHCCIFFENLCDLFKKIGNFCITMSFLLAVALSLKIHIRHCICMYPILQRPNMTISDYLTLCNYPYFHQKHPLETKQTILPDVTVRRIVNPGDDDA